MIYAGNQVFIPCRNIYHNTLIYCFSLLAFHKLFILLFIQDMCIILASFYFMFKSLKSVILLNRNWQQ